MSESRFKFKVEVLGYLLFFIELLFTVTATKDALKAYILHLFTENLYQWCTGHGSSVSHAPFYMNGERDE